MTLQAANIIWPEQGESNQPRKGYRPGKNPNSHKSPLMALKGAAKAQAKTPNTVIGVCPAGEPKAVRSVWKRITPQMKDFLHESDRTIVLEICRLIVERDLDYQRLQKDGRYQLNKDGISVDAPWARRWERLGGLLVKYFVRLGLSPTDRQRIIHNAQMAQKRSTEADDDIGLEDD